METLDEMFTKTIAKNRLIKFEYYIQVTLFWIIIASGITLIGLYISTMLMIPWGIIQLISALKNTIQIKDHQSSRKFYFAYWAGVLLVVILFVLCATLHEDDFAIIAMLLSFVLGCFHTYIIRRIYLDHKSTRYEKD
jgi:hypothetical protein